MDHAGDGQARERLLFVSPKRRAERARELRGRELMLATVKAGPEQRSHLVDLVAIFDGQVIDVGTATMTVMVAGTPDGLDAVTDLLSPHGIVELQRTGRIALPRLIRGARPLKAVKPRPA